MRRIAPILMVGILAGCATALPQGAQDPPALAPIVAPNLQAAPYVGAAQQAAHISRRSGQVITLLVDDPQGIAQRCGLCTDGPRIFAASSFLRGLPTKYQVAFFAHEFAHGDLGHSTVQGIVDAGLDAAASQIQVPMQYWLGASAAYSVGKFFASSAVSRHTEHAADLYAAHRLPWAGLPSQTLAEALRYLTNLQGETGGGWLATHPSMPQRIAAIEALARKPRQRSVTTRVKKVARYCPSGDYASNVDRFCPHHRVKLEARSDP